MINPLNPFKKSKVDDQQRIETDKLPLPKGTKTNPATNINNGSNKMDSSDFSVEKYNRNDLYRETKCHIPPGKYLNIFVLIKTFIIFKLLL
jgi:hypothetical protein